MAQHLERESGFRDMYDALDELMDVAAAAIISGAYDGTLELNNARAALAKARGESV